MLKTFSTFETVFSQFFLFYVAFQIFGKQHRRGTVLLLHRHPAPFTALLAILDAKITNISETYIDLPQIYTLFNRIVHECGHCITRKTVPRIKVLVSMMKEENRFSAASCTCVPVFPFSRFVMRFCKQSVSFVAEH
jgi:hypothetical protein